MAVSLCLGIMQKMKWCEKWHSVSQAWGARTPRQKCRRRNKEKERKVPQYYLGLLSQHIRSRRCTVSTGTSTTGSVYCSCREYKYSNVAMGNHQRHVGGWVEGRRYYLSRINCSAVGAKTPSWKTPMSIHSADAITSLVLTSYARRWTPTWTPVSPEAKREGEDSQSAS